jgi:hypothetical protein
VRKTKELHEGNFGQKPAKRGTCLEVRILRELRAEKLI